MRRIALQLFATFWLLYALHFATNIVREIYLALSIGDRLSFDVSDYLGLHPDLFEMPGRGAFVNNNPGASMVGAVPYASRISSSAPCSSWDSASGVSDASTRLLPRDTGEQGP